MRVEHSYVEKVLLLLQSQKSWALLSSLPSSCTLAVLRGNLSPGNGWMPGSDATLGHTSVKSWAVRSLIWL